MARPPDIFAFLDYRAFLKAWLAHRRAQDPGFTFDAFAAESGLSRSTLPNILAGTRSPKPATLDALGVGIGLDPTERNYLGLLVALDAAPTVVERRAALRRLTTRASYGHKAWLEDDPSTFERYLSRWYHVAIRELAQLPGFQADAAWVAKTLMPPIGEDQAAEALALLFDTGLLTREADGSVKVPEIRLESRPDVEGEVMARYHEEVVPQVLGRLRDTSHEERQFVGLCIALTDDGRAEAKRVLWEALQAVAAIGDAEDDAGRRVYFLALQLAPVSGPVR